MPKCRDGMRACISAFQPDTARGEGLATELRIVQNRLQAMEKVSTCDELDFNDGKDTIDDECNGSGASSGAGSAKDLRATTRVLPCNTFEKIEAFCLYREHTDALKACTTIAEFDADKRRKTIIRLSITR